MKNSTNTRFFARITEKLNESTNSISFGKKDKIDPDLISRYFGERPADSEIKRLQSLANSISKDKFLEISFN